MNNKKVNVTRCPFGRNIVLHPSHTHWAFRETHTHIIVTLIDSFSFACRSGETGACYWSVGVSWPRPWYWGHSLVSEGERERQGRREGERERQGWREGERETRQGQKEGYKWGGEREEGPEVKGTVNLNSNSNNNNTHCVCDASITCPIWMMYLSGKCVCLFLCTCVGQSGPSEGHQKSSGSERQEGEKAQEEGEER